MPQPLDTRSCSSPRSSHSCSSVFSARSVKIEGDQLVATQEQAISQGRVIASGRMRISFERIALYLLLIAGVVVMMTPFVWTLLASFKTNSDIFRAPVTFLPRVWTTANYTNLLSGDSVPFVRQFINSCIIAIGQTVLAVAISSLAGFAFAKYEFAGKRLLFVLTLLTLMIPFEVTVVPLFNL